MENLEAYTPVERVLMIVSSIVSQSQIVLMSVANGDLHPLGVYQNEYGKIVQMGKPQRKTLVGIIVTGDTLQPLTDAFIAARETPEGQALLQKIAEIQQANSGGQDDAQDESAAQDARKAGAEG